MHSEAHYTLGVAGVVSNAECSRLSNGLAGAHGITCRVYRSGAAGSAALREGGSLALDAAVALALADAPAG